MNMESQGHRTPQGSPGCTGDVCRPSSQPPVQLCGANQISADRPVFLSEPQIVEPVANCNGSSLLEGNQAATQAPSSVTQQADSVPVAYSLVSEAQATHQSTANNAKPKKRARKLQRHMSECTAETHARGRSDSIGHSSGSDEFHESAKMRAASWFRGAEDCVDRGDVRPGTEWYAGVLWHSLLSNRMQLGNQARPLKCASSFGGTLACSIGLQVRSML